MHTDDAVAEATLPYVPTAHFVQVGAPGASVYEPAAQLKHKEAPRELYEPGAHATHRSDESAPAPLLNLPAEHAVHTVGALAAV